MSRVDRGLIAGSFPLRLRMPCLLPKSIAKVLKSEICGTSVQPVQVTHCQLTYTLIGARGYLRRASTTLWLQEFRPRPAYEA